MSVSKAEGPGRAGVAVHLFFKDAVLGFKECCFRVRVRVRLGLLLVSTLTPTLILT